MNKEERAKSEENLKMFIEAAKKEDDFILDKVDSLGLNYVFQFSFDEKDELDDLYGISDLSIHLESEYFSEVFKEVAKEVVNKEFNLLNIQKEFIYFNEISYIELFECGIHCYAVECENTHKDESIQTIFNSDDFEIFLTEVFEIILEKNIFERVSEKSKDQKKLDRIHFIIENYDNVELESLDTIFSCEEERKIKVEYINELDIDCTETFSFPTEFMQEVGGIRLNRGEAIITNNLRSKI